MILGSVILVLALCLVPVYTMHAAAQVQPQSAMTMNDAETATIHSNGDVSVREVITMSASFYATLKQQYPSLSSLTRLFNPVYSSDQYQNLQVVENDGNNSLIATYNLLGAAGDQGNGQWKFVTPNSQGASLTLAGQTSSTLIFTFALSVSGNTQEIITLTINFPPQSSGIKFDSSSNSVTYSLPTPTQASGGNIAYLAGAGGLVLAGVGVLFVGLRPRHV